MTISKAAVVGDVIYFTRTDSKSGSADELWASRGNPGDAAVVIDIEWPWPAGHNVELFPITDKLVVRGVEGPDPNGVGLWVASNATTRGERIRDFDGWVNDWDGGSAIMNGVLYFSANDGVHGTELWRTDGTAGGTYLLADIVASDSSGYPQHLTAAGNQLFFGAYTAATGRELYVSDGTGKGTRRISDLDANLDVSAEPVDLTPLGNKVVFTSLQNQWLKVLYVSDGTAKGTRSLGVEGTSISEFLTVGKQVFFEVETRNGEVQLWRTDGTAAGTRVIFDVGHKPSSVSNLKEWAGQLYFTANTGSGFRYMISDGTTAGTREGSLPFIDGGVSVWPEPFGAGKWVFDRLGVCLTDGSAAGTRKVSELDAERIWVGENKVYFTHISNEGLHSLSVYDPNAGAIAGTVFDDADADGARDTNEKALSGYKVYIDRNNDGVCNKNERWTRASSTGRYRFDLVPAGKYRVRIVGVEGRRGSTADSFVAKVTPDGTFTRYFGRTERVLVAGIVYMDANKNGTIDNGESGMAGWTAFVDSDRDGVQDGDELTAITDDLGRFVFSTLPAGTWQVRVSAQTKYKLTAPGSGYRSVTLGVGESSGKSNFGQKRIA